MKCRILTCKFNKERLFYKYYRCDIILKSKINTKIVKFKGELEAKLLFFLETEKDYLRGVTI